MSTVTHVYRHDVATVLALLLDPEFLRERCQALGETHVDVTRRDDGDKVVVTTNRDVRRELPGFAAKLFKPTNHVMQTETWHTAGDPRRGSYHIDVRGAPMTIDAAMTLRAHPDGCEYSITYTIRASVPLIRKRLEKFALDQTVTGLRKEIAFNERRLRGE